MIFIGLICGMVLTLVCLHERLLRAKQFNQIRDENVELKSQLAAEKVISQSYKQQLDGLDERLTQHFKTASLELFKENARTFVQLSENGVKHYQQETKEAFHAQNSLLDKILEPLKTNLVQFTNKVEQLEIGRQKTDVTFKEQLQQLSQFQQKLENKTDLLMRAFGSPNQRGRWGELQLRRIVELAGMLDHVDFNEQVTVNEGKLRPDMIIHMPNDRCVIVDAKTPQLDDYLSAVSEQQSEEKQQATLDECCKKIRTLVNKLSAKDYNVQVPHSIDFIVLFFPGEWFFSHALQADSGLIEYGCQNNVVFATPTTLIALLKAIHYGWRQNEMVDEVHAVIDSASDLYERLCTFGEHFQGLRKNLSNTVESYNQLIGSLDSRVIPAARRLKKFYKKKNAVLKIPKKLETDC